MRGGVGLGKHDMRMRLSLYPVRSWRGVLFLLLGERGLRECECFFFHFSCLSTLVSLFVKMGVGEAVNR